MFHRSELIAWPNALTLARPVHIALPLQSGEWLLLTRYPLLQDFLASIHLCGLQQPVEETVWYLDTHKMSYFCWKLMPHIQTEKANFKYFIALMSLSYEDDCIPGSSCDSVVVSHTAISAKGMCWVTFSARKVTFDSCDFSPAAATILSSSIGDGGNVHTLVSDRRWVEYVR